MQLSSTPQSREAARQRLNSVRSTTSSQEEKGVKLGLGDFIFYRYLNTHQITTAVSGFVLPLV